MLRIVIRALTAHLCLSVGVSNAQEQASWQITEGETFRGRPVVGMAESVAGAEDGIARLWCNPFSQPGEVAFSIEILPGGFRDVWGEFFFNASSWTNTELAGLLSDGVGSHVRFGTLQVIGGSAGPLETWVIETSFSVDDLTFQNFFSRFDTVEVLLIPLALPGGSEILSDDRTYFSLGIGGTGLTLPTEGFSTVVARARVVCENI